MLSDVAKSPEKYFDKFSSCGEKSGTVTFKLVGNANIFLGVSIEIDLSFDKYGNIALQYSYSLPIDDETANIGLLDIGAMMGVQFTNAETVYDLEGVSGYVGASAGASFSGGLDIITFDDLANPNAGMDGFQMLFGIGIGVDAHVQKSKTETIFVW